MHSVEVTATDVAGNMVTRTVPFRIVATVDSLINLYADEGRIDTGNRRGLLDKLNDAKAALKRWPIGPIVDPKQKPGAGPGSKLVVNWSG